MDDGFTLQDLVDEVAPGARRRRPARENARIVVAGEFASGKSSVINMLLRRQLLPCNPGLSTRPLIRIVPGKMETIEALDVLGNKYQPRNVEALARVDHLTECTITLPELALRRTEIFEVPFDHEEGISPENLDLIDGADRIIWTTIASQAWRLSEKALLDQLEAAPHREAVLAVSRADKLRTQDDVEKIAQRLQKDASGFFTEMVFIKASTENLASARNNQIWRKSGGADLSQIVFGARRAAN